jgi:hypothetical protein
MDSPTPSIKALLVCDAVAQESGTGKKSILGLFNYINVGSFPCSHPQMAVYFCIVDAEGLYNFRLELVRLNTDEIIAKGEFGPLEVKDRFQVLDASITLRGLIFPEEGKYEYRLFANGTFLESKELTLKKIGATS